MTTWEEGVMMRKQFIHYAKRVRNWLFILTGTGILSLIFARLFPSLVTRLTVIIILVTVIAPFFVAVVLQVVIVLLVGKPPDPPKDEFGIHQKVNPENLEKVSVNDWLGANAYLRVGILLILIAFFAGIGLTDNAAAIWEFLAVVTLLGVWSLCASISRITFDRMGVSLESASFHSWGFGRNVSVPYHELSVRQSKWFGDWATLYRSGHRVCVVTRNRWLSYKYLQILYELSERLPENQCSFFWVYRN